MLAIRDGKIPPTINLENLDPGCAELGLDFTANRAVREARALRALQQLRLRRHEREPDLRQRFKARAQCRSGENSPRVLIASDHAGVELKSAIQKALARVHWKDLGPIDRRARRLSGFRREALRAKSPTAKASAAS